MTTELNAWPSLGEFLDAGGDFEALLRADGTWDLMVEHLFVEIPRHLPSHRAEHGRRWRVIWAEPTPMKDGSMFVPAFEQARCHDWECDLWENPDLLDRVMASLSPEALAEGREQAGKYFGERLKILVQDRPESMPFWECVSCGKPFPETVAAIVTGEDEAANCRDCVAAVLERYDRGEVDVREDA